MKRAFHIALACALTLPLTALTARAEKADANKPTDVTSAQMDYDDVKQVNVFTGAVVIVRGTLLMKAGKAVMVQDAAGYQFATLYAAPGTLASFRQKRDGGDFWVEGQAERIEYDGKAEVVKFFSRARLKRLEGSKTTDEVEGEYIVYDSNSEFFTVKNSSDGKDNNKRIKTVIQPRTDTRPAAEGK